MNQRSLGGAFFCELAIIQKARARIRMSSRGGACFGKGGRRGREYVPCCFGDLRWTDDRDRIDSTFMCEIEVGR